MSQLKLGAEGAALVVKQYSGGIAKAPTELDFLLNDILHPGDETSLEKVISYLAYYYPKIKNKANVELLTRALINSPLFFSSSSINYNSLYKLVECFRHLIDTKFRISIPTLPFVDFYSAIYDGVRKTLEVDSQALWKIMPLAAGCLLSKKSRKDFDCYPNKSYSISTIDAHFKSILHSAFLIIFKSNASYDLQALAVTCLASVYEILDDKCYADYTLIYPELPEFVISLLLNSLYGLDNGQELLNRVSFDTIMKEKPLLRQLNKVAFMLNKLIAQSVIDSDLKSLSCCLNTVFEYSKVIASNKTSLSSLLHSDKWNLIKYNYFALIIILDGITTKVLKSFVKPNLQAMQLSILILKTLLNTSFILNQIGTGGFDSYNFVYQANVATLIQSNEKELVTNFIWDLMKLETSKDNLQLLLQFIESLLSILEPNFTKKMIIPFVHKLLQSKDSSDIIIEASHSIMIKYLSLVNQSILQAPDEDMMTYIILTLNQFPSKILYEDCREVVSQASQYMGSTDLESLLDILQARAVTGDFSPLPKRFVYVNGERKPLKEKYHTFKASMIGLLITVIHYVPDDQLFSRLNSLKMLIEGCQGKQDIHTLFDHLWEKILLCNKFNSKKGSMLLGWWYEEVNNAQISKL